MYLNLQLPLCVCLLLHLACPHPSVFLSCFGLCSWTLSLLFPHRAFVYFWFPVLTLACHQLGVCLCVIIKYTELIPLCSASIYALGPSLFCNVPGTRLTIRCPRPKWGLVWPIIAETSQNRHRGQPGCGKKAAEQKEQ